MSNDEIKDFYDCNPNMLLRELSVMTGKSVQELKRILMS